MNTLELKQEFDYREKEVLRLIDIQKAVLLDYLTLKNYPIEFDTVRNAWTYKGDIALKIENGIITENMYRLNVTAREQVLISGMTRTLQVLLSELTELNAERIKAEAVKPDVQPLTVEPEPELKPQTGTYVVKGEQAGRITSFDEDDMDSDWKRS